MTAHTANENFARTVRSERKITGQILKMILDFEDNKYHIELGYWSLFEWLTKAHGYDEGFANRRIQAARAMRAVPEVEQKLQDGKTTMTNLVKAQSIFRQTKLSADEKREVIESIEGQTTAEATQTLFRMFPEAASQINQDRRMVVSDEQVRLAFNVTKELEGILTRAKELLSHKIPGGSMAEVIAFLAEYFVERNDPLRKKPAVPRKAPQVITENIGEGAKESIAADVKSGKPTRPAKSTAVASKQRVTVKTRKEVIQDADGRCEYVNPITGKRCDNRVQLEADHIQMRVFGGSNKRENLRCLCRVHNQFMSEKSLGKDWANHWRRK